MGGEWGADFTGSNSIFVDGMMTLQRTWWADVVVSNIQTNHLPGTHPGSKLHAQILLVPARFVLPYKAVWQRDKWYDQID